VTIGSSVTSIGNGAFYFCTSLTSITIPNSVTSIGTGPFAACTSLTAIDVNAANANYASIDGVLYDKAIANLIQCPGGWAGAFTILSSVTSIGNGAFSSCTSLTSITIPNSVTSIRDWAFYFCTSLTSVTIPDGVTSIRNYTFYYCTSLTSITFLGLVAPTTVDTDWILSTSSTLRGHAYATSNFPAPGGVWNGLTMGAIIPVSPASDNTMLILVAVIAIAVVLVVVLFVMRKRKGTE
jgi:hypothetical protein